MRVKRPVWYLLTAFLAVFFLFQASTAAEAAG